MRTRTSTLSILAAALAVLAIAVVPAGAAGAAPTPAQAARAAQAAYLYGIPLMEFLRTAREQTSVTVPNTHSDAPVNQFGSARQLATPSNHVIVQPNNDTLYSMAHLDLSGGALVLHVAAVPGHRYYVLQFMDPYTNVFAYVGTRTTGDGAHTFLITGPAWHGRVPAGMRRIRSPYELAWIAGRTLVDGAADLPAVHRVQDGYRLIPLAAYLRAGLRWTPPRPRRVLTTAKTFLEPAGLRFFDALGVALAQNPPPARDRAELALLRTVGVGPGLMPSREHLSPVVVAALRHVVATGHQLVLALKTRLAAPSVVAHHGWFVPFADTGAYGTDYSWRAVVALNGLAANRPAEAMYIIGVRDSHLAALSGADQYVIHFPAGGLPPARFFWSLTMYNAAFYLVANPLHKYEVGNRTAGLRRNADGSLDVYIGHTRPAGAPVANWLPAPTGAFQVDLRLYGPGRSALEGTYSYPGIARLG
jgi:hypothetical protein